MYRTYMNTLFLETKKLYINYITEFTGFCYHILQSDSGGCYSHRSQDLNLEAIEVSIIYTAYC